MATFKLAKMHRGYPLQLAGEFTRCTFTDKSAALAALGEHVDTWGYAGTFNPVHPAATDYYLIARSTKDSSLVVVSDSEE